MNKSATEEFDKVKQRLKDSWQVKQMLPALRAMQETVTELQEQGIAISLDVRPAGLDRHPYAKGELEIDGVPLEFVLTRNSSYENELQLFREGNLITSMKVRLEDERDAAEFKSELRTKLYTVKALSEMYGEFSVSSGVSRLQSVKPGAPKLSA